MRLKYYARYAETTARSIRRPRAKRFRAFYTDTAKFAPGNRSAAYVTTRFSLPLFVLLLLLRALVESRECKLNREFVRGNFYASIVEIRDRRNATCKLTQKYRNKRLRINKRTCARARALQSLSARVHAMPGWCRPARAQIARSHRRQFSILQNFQ